MSRLAKKPIPLPDKAKTRVNGAHLEVEGPLGKNLVLLHPLVKIEADAKQVLVKRVDDSREAKTAQGCVWSLVTNAIQGSTAGFTKVLDIQGVGYRAEVKGDELSMTLGYSHPVNYKIPKGVKIAVEKQTRLSVSGFSCEQVGQVAATIRGFRAPEPYKGKGVKYENEVIQRKVGKAAATAGGK